MKARLNRLLGWERLWLVTSIGLSLAAFVLFLGDPAIYDASYQMGTELNDRWLATQKLEWGGRCIPGTWRESNALTSAYFSCYSIAVDGGQALLGAGAVAVASYLGFRIVRWVIKGFQK